MRTKAVTAACWAQQHYNTNYDKRVKEVPVFANEDLFYSGKNAPATLTKADDTSRKLRENEARRYKIVNAQRETVTNESDGTLDTVSVDRTMIAQRKDEILPSAPAAQMNDETDGIRLPKAKTETDKHIGENSRIDYDHFGQNLNHADEYVIDRPVACTIETRRTLYHVRRYGYAASDDTVESADRLPDHFTRRYWQRQNRRS